MKGGEREKGQLESNKGKKYRGKKNFSFVLNIITKEQIINNPS